MGAGEGWRTLCLCEEGLRCMETKEGSFGGERSVSGEYERRATHFLEDYGKWEYA
jgi:hypothetical protein